jgi:hypothetical protein
MNLSNCRFYFRSKVLHWRINHMVYMDLRQQSFGVEMPHYVYSKQGLEQIGVQTRKLILLATAPYFQKWYSALILFSQQNAHRGCRVTAVQPNITTTVGRYPAQYLGGWSRCVAESLIFQSLIVSGISCFRRRDSIYSSDGMVIGLIMTNSLRVGGSYEEALASSGD